MNSDRKWLIPKDNIRLLSSIIKYLCGEAFIYFEGNISPKEFNGINFYKKVIPLVNRESPESKYMVALPLEDNTCDFILKKIIPRNLFINEISAIQIIKNGRLQFLSGDNFHRECISVDSEISESFLNQLIDEGIIKSYR
jgi:hypothetical protein